MTADTYTEVAEIAQRGLPKQRLDTILCVVRSWHAGVSLVVHEPHVPAVEP